MSITLYQGWFQGLRGWNTDAANYLSSIPGGDWYLKFEIAEKGTPIEGQGTDRDPDNTDVCPCSNAWELLNGDFSLTNPPERGDIFSCLYKAHPNLFINLDIKEKLAPTDNRSKLQQRLHVIQSQYLDCLKSMKIKDIKDIKNGINVFALGMKDLTNLVGNRTLAEAFLPADLALDNFQKLVTYAWDGNDHIVQFETSKHSGYYYYGTS